MCGLVAERTVGHTRQEKPDWFLESTDILMLLLQMKMKCMKECYRTTVYQMVRSSVGSKEWQMSQAVQAAKEKWILRVASEGEKAVKDEVELYQETAVGSCWMEIDQAQCCAKEGGVPTAGLDEESSRWHRHFTKLLTITSRFQEEVITGMPPQPVCQDLDISPTVKELGTGTR